MGTRKLSVEDTCIYHDEKGRPLNALVNCVHGDDWEHSLPCINVTFVSPDKKRQDTFGRQIEHASSVPHKSNAGAHGYYWRFADEEAIPYSEPAQT
jgi:hypothetical protein